MERKIVLAFLEIMLFLSILFLLFGQITIFNLEFNSNAQLTFTILGYILGISAIVIFFIRK